jgi:hypothetical protein
MGVSEIMQVLTAILGMFSGMINVLVGVAGAGIGLGWIISVFRNK